VIPYLLLPIITAKKSLVLWFAVVSTRLAKNAAQEAMKKVQRNQAQ
jgi:hypothetical protein